ncbi:MAG TPA: hypothetical protein VFH71_04550 [Rhodanobacteraceae bacterium]|nr:hypothetical protein [Rhodanobacteraceae bacterium]
MSAVNLRTKLFQESYGGIIICGYNWGTDQGSSVSAASPAGSSFFSNQDTNGFRYVNRLINLLGLWGLSLERKEGRETKLERSFTQTNWRNTETKALSDDTWTEYELNCGNFLETVQHLRPRLVIFCGLRLLELLNSPSVLPLSEKGFGKHLGEPRYCVKPKLPGRKQFRVGFQDFERVRVIAIPHPTGSRGLSNEYMEQFRNEIFSRLREALE